MHMVIIAHKTVMKCRIVNRVYCFRSLYVRERQAGGGNPVETSAVFETLCREGTSRGEAEVCSYH